MSLSTDLVMRTMTNSALVGCMHGRLALTLLASTSPFISPVTWTTSTSPFISPVTWTTSTTDLVVKNVEIHLHLTAVVQLSYFSRVTSVRPSPKVDPWKLVAIASLYFI